MTGVLGFYYKSDAEVGQDSELQTWIQDIFEHGFLSLESTGVLVSLYYYIVLSSSHYVNSCIFMNSQESLKHFTL